MARIGDRGPRHAMVDLAPATTRALRANGWETVWMMPIDLKAIPVGFIQKLTLPVAKYAIAP